MADGDPAKYLAAGKLTLPQLLNLAHEKPPRSGPQLDTFEGYAAYAERRRRELEEW